MSSISPKIKNIAKGRGSKEKLINVRINPVTRPVANMISRPGIAIGKLAWVSTIIDVEMFQNSGTKKLMIPVTSSHNARLPVACGNINVVAANTSVNG